MTNCGYKLKPRGMTGGWEPVGDKPVLGGALGTCFDCYVMQEDGIYKIFIDPEDTNGLEFGRYVYDVEIIKGDIKTTIEAGILNINHEVTCASDEV